jgi:uncharacterized protein with gpF-like domain
MNKEVEVFNENEVKIIFGKDNIYNYQEINEENNELKTTFQVKNVELSELFNFAQHLVSKNIIIDFQINEPTLDDVLRNL